MDDLMESPLGLRELSLEIIGSPQEVVHPIYVRAMGIEFTVLLKLILSKAVQLIVEGTNGSGQKLFWGMGGT
jgi:hypothetical protein